MRFFLIFLLLLNTIFSQQVSKEILISPSLNKLGHIPDTKDVPMKYTITNNTGKTINITKVKTSCGCSSAVPNPKKIAPGEKSILKAHLDPRGRQGYGRWEIKVHTDVPSQPMLVVAFDATILKNATLSRRFINFGEFEQGASIEKKIWIAPLKYPKFKVFSAKQILVDKKDAFDIAIKKDIYNKFYPGPRPAYCITLKTKKDIPFGRLEGALQITTDIPKREKIEIKILARIAGDIGINPDYISLGMLRAHSKTFRNLYIYHRKGETFDLKSAEASIEFATTKILEVISKQYYKVIVTCEPKEIKKGGEFRGTLTLKTSNKKQPVIKIPMQGYLAPTK